MYNLPNSDTFDIRECNGPLDLVKWDENNRYSSTSIEISALLMDYGRAEMQKMELA